MQHARTACARFPTCKTLAFNSDVRDFLIQFVHFMMNEWRINSSTNRADALCY